MYYSHSPTTEYTTRSYRWRMQGWIARFIAVNVMTMIGFSGCSKDSIPTNELNPGWVIIELRDDRGHDTLASPDGQMYHNYFCAVVLRKNGETLSLLYENELPEELKLEVGQRFIVDGLNDATYAEDWKGYWIHDITLRSIMPKH